MNWVSSLEGKESKSRGSNQIPKKVNNDLNQKRKCDGEKKKKKEKIVESLHLAEFNGNVVLNMKKEYA